MRKILGARLAVVHVQVGGRVRLDVDAVARVTQARDGDEGVGRVHRHARASLVAEREPHYIARSDDPRGVPHSKIGNALQYLEVLQPGLRAESTEYATELNSVGIFPWRFTFSPNSNAGGVG